MLGECAKQAMREQLCARCAEDGVVFLRGAEVLSALDDGKATAGNDDCDAFMRWKFKLADFFLMRKHFFKGSTRKPVRPS